MTKDHNKVWYASYGSNLQMERFLCYIRGGQPYGRPDIYEGCLDKTLPEDNEEFYICSRLYFAKESSGWNKGGVGFISNTFDNKSQTLARMYLITKEQFVDVVKQETKFKGNLEINFDECINNGSLIFKDPSWYGNLIYLGEQNQQPIFTFTSKEDFSHLINRPDRKYLKTIIEGIKEVFPFDDNEICDYLFPLEGIEGNYTRKELLDLING
ncbi:MAG: hypothetical protein K9H61_09640 [Bacteroidia bacterium]|nr:hypothetical protein [Bacteroidia bacterium]MCF8425139.1 hypothetical protein [Bacteroidia bacterium]MCF8447243.1 hypothetical protein [Bacteroidia bacterium]